MSVKATFINLLLTPLPHFIKLFIKLNSIEIFRYQTYKHAVHTYIHITKLVDIVLPIRHTFVYHLKYPVLKTYKSIMFKVEQGVSTMFHIL